ncbi:group III truncated hemoglobin [Celeribacter sp.]|uniref:group III truncated hemoglobin n=1 Tax=Celeribacter sp. TaxID=1890673 RepID=UPI003A8D10B3
MSETRSALPPKFEISHEDMDRVLARFYAGVRQHPELGPVFGAHVEDWPAHEEKIGRFWRNAILHERQYDGFPQRVHLMAPEVKEHHFAIWLGLFDEMLTAELDPETAAKWSEMAHRIGRAFRMGIMQRDQPKDAPPKLF